MTTNNRVERIKQEFKERFLPTQFKANGGDDQKLADIMYRAMVSSYDEWFTKTLTQLEKEVRLEAWEAIKTIKGHGDYTHSDFMDDIREILVPPTLDN